MSLPYRKHELRSVFLQLQACLENGDPEQEIADNFGLVWEQYLELKTVFLQDQESYLLQRSNAEVYLEYMHRQSRGINELNELIAEVRTQHDKKPAVITATVTAIKARSDIIDRIMNRGQELGIIDKTPDRRVIEGQVSHRMSDDQLRVAITDELQKLADLKIDTAPTILDIEPGPLHAPAPKEKALFLAE